MDWLYYLLEANLYLLIFYGFYRLFLHNETFYNSNRYFLLLSSITAFLLPIMQLGFLNPAPVVDNVLFPPPVLYTAEEMAKLAAAPAVETIDYTTLLYPIYLCIACCFAIKLAFSLAKIIRIWKKATKAKSGNITLIELNEQTTAFSFFNLLFIHPHLAEKQTVLNHEMVHIKQKHSIDILFLEILQVICWFNPIIYFIKRDIKLLHEYIADELSTSKGMQKHDYAMFLIENSFGIVPTPLTNQIFNQSILKRRINMLNKKRTAGWARLRLLLALPLAAGMLCASTMAFTKSYGYIDLLPEKVSLQTPDKKVSDEITMAKKGFYSPNYVFDENNQYKSLDQRLIIINGVAVKDNNKFYGVSNADKILFFNSKNATEKYGAKGKYGAVEVYGKPTVMTYQPEYVIADTAKFPAPNPKKDQVKFPPPIVRQTNLNFFAKRNYKASSTHAPYADKRYILFNGKPVSDTTFWGVFNATKIKHINSSEAIPTYGEVARNGAVEIMGGIIKYIKPGDAVPPPPVEPPPAPKKDQIKFPPPIIRKDKTSFFPMRSVDKNGNVIRLDSRFIVINGKKIEDIKTFYGITNATKIIDLDAATAVKKYGKAAKYGAVEITGNNLKYLKSIADGPPPPIETQVKFPPPIVRPDKKSKQTSSATKKIAEQVKRNQEVISATTRQNNQLMQ
ncbi:MAG: M56 family metallopeptidase [Pedobacter sp.]|nr:MAG: M56 family metallopeptidase [Pedobacter sp.]